MQQGPADTLFRFSVIGGTTRSGEPAGFVAPPMAARFLGPAVSGCSASLTVSLDTLRRHSGRAEAGATRRVIRHQISPASTHLHSAYGRQGQARFAGDWQGLGKSSLRVIRSHSQPGWTGRRSAPLYPLSPWLPASRFWVAFCGGVQRMGEQLAPPHAPWLRSVGWAGRGLPVCPSDCLST